MTRAERLRSEAEGILCVNNCLTTMNSIGWARGILDRDLGLCLSERGECSEDWFEGYQEGWCSMDDALKAEAWVNSLRASVSE
jgi:hypothetical protein